MNRLREKRIKQRWIVCGLAFFLVGSGIWLGCKGYRIGKAADDGGAGLQELQGVRWEKELFGDVNEDYSAYLNQHILRNDYMEEEAAQRFGLQGYVWDYREGLAIGYDHPSSTWYCFDEDGNTVFTVKTEFPAEEVPSGAGNYMVFQNGLAALSISDEKTCVVDRSGRMVIAAFHGRIYMCRDSTALFQYSHDRYWSWGVARLGEGKLKGGEGR